MSVEPADYDQRSLRIVHCAGCEALQQQIDRMTSDMNLRAEDYNLLELEAQRLRRSEDRLKKQVAQGIRDDVDYGPAYELFKFWEKVTGEQGIWDQTCQKTIMRALKILKRHYKQLEDEAKANGEKPGREAPDELATRALACAFLGVARRGFIDPNDKKRHNRIGLVCKDGESLKKNIERYRDHVRSQGKEPVV